jgi:hypothetical protein
MSALLERRRPLVVALALFALLETATVLADTFVTVEMDKTVRVDVGLANGLNCDDLSVARVEIRAQSPQNNQLVVTGLKPGVTACRAGLPQGGATVLVHIRVVEPPSDGPSVPEPH